jgi:hypothetical protein
MSIITSILFSLSANVIDWRIGKQKVTREQNVWHLKRYLCESKNVNAWRIWNHSSVCLWRLLINLSFVRLSNYIPERSMMLSGSLDDRGFESWLRLGNFLFTTASRLLLGPTNPRIKWVPGALSLGVQRPGREADHSPPSSAEVKECVELYLHSPNTNSWLGAQLRKAQGQPYLYLYIIS